MYVGIPCCKNYGSSVQKPMVGASKALPTIIYNHHDTFSLLPWDFISVANIISAVLILQLEFTSTYLQIFLDSYTVPGSTWIFTANTIIL